MRAPWLVALCGVALLAVPSYLRAQDDFEAFKRKEAERLKSFISKDDSTFADFLKKDWRDFALSVAPAPIKRPKPSTTPIAPTTPTRPPAITPTVAPAGAPLPPPAPSAPAAEPTRALPSGAIPIAAATPGAAPVLRGPRSVAPGLAVLPANALRSAFFGATVVVPKPQLELQPLPRPLTQAAIAAFWQQISSVKTDSILAALKGQREAMRLGDYPYAELVYRTALTLAAGDTVMARLISWHLLVKSGFAVRVGFSESQVHLLLKSEQTLYGVSFFTTDQGRYYALDLGGGAPPHVGAVRTYDGDYPGARSAVAFQMPALPTLVENLQPRVLRFSYAGRPYEIRVDVNRNLVDLLNYYPQTELAGYLDATVESAAMDELLAALRPIVANRPERDAVNVLLRFVQTAFDYETDGQQFQREKWMFPEETLFYPYSDCEDRAILFSYLVRKLVGLPVVGLIYADHVAAAVRFSTEVPGDSRIFRGERYVVTDPTYINADVGMEMPQYKEASPTIVAARRLPAP